MAVAFDSGSIVGTHFSTSVTSYVVTLPATINAGDLIEVLLAINNSTRTITGVPSGFTLIDDQIAETTDHFSALYRKVADGTEDSTTVTFTLSGGSTGHALAWRITGADGTTPGANNASGSNAASTATDAHVAPSITPAVNNCLVVTVITENGTSGTTSPQYTPEAGWTEVYDANQGAAPFMVEAIAHRTQTTAAAEAPAWTTVNSLPTAVFIYAIRPGTGEQTVSGVGAIASAEAFGTNKLNMNIAAAGAIASAEAVGSPGLGVPVAPSGIASAEAFGTALLSYRVSPSGIASAEAVGSPSVGFGGILSPAGIASAEAFGTILLNARSVLSIESIGSQEVFGEPLLGHYVAPSAIASGEAVGDPTLTVGAPIIGVIAIDSVEAFGAPTLNLILYPAGIVSAQAFGSPALTAPRWKVYVNDEDRTTDVRPLRAFHIEMLAGEELGILDAELWVSDGLWEPLPEDDIRVEDAAVEVYEGQIRQRSVAPLAGTSDVRYAIHAQDLTALLDDDYIITAVRTVSETGKARIEWLLNTHGSKGIVGGATIVAPQLIPSGEDGIARQDFNGMTLRAAIEAVLNALARGQRYYVDRDYKLHVFEDVEAGLPAPFGFSETPNGSSTEPIIGFTLNEDSVLLRHKQLVVGGTDRSIRRERDLADVGQAMPAAGDVRGAVHADSSITSDMQADALADNLLRLYGHVQRSGTLITYRSGLKAGMNAVLDHPAAGLDTFAIRIREMDIDLLSDTVVRYTVHWGDVPPPLVNWRDAHFSSEELPIPPQPDTITGDMIVDLAIATTHIQAGAILTPKLAANAVTANEIAANAITAVKINAAAVTTVKLDAGAVTADKIAAGSITADKIAAGVINAGHIAAGSITTTKLAADSVTAASIAAGAVTATELAAGSVTATKLASGSITTDKLVAGQVAIRNSSGVVILDPNALALQVVGQWNMSMGATSVAGTTAVRQLLSSWPHSYPPFCVGMVNVGGGKSVLMPYLQWNVVSGVINTFFYAYATASFVECVRITRVAAPAISFRVLALLQGAING